MTARLPAPVLTRDTTAGDWAAQMLAAGYQPAYARDLHVGARFYRDQQHVEVIGVAPHYTKVQRRGRWTDKLVTGWRDITYLDDDGHQQTIGIWDNGRVFKP
jgi:hypothetical protein